MATNNTGIENTGNWNSGDMNSGDWNSGDMNSGNMNSGYWNSGNWNSGEMNSGNWNSGNRNSGNMNSGDMNSGNGNSGYGNSINRESGIFCSEQGTVRLFNKPTSLKWEDIDHPNFYEFYLTKWIPESEMTDEEKKNDPNFFVRQGYLKTFTWEEAWSNYWRYSYEEEKQKVLNLPNFDSKVFKDITGIDVETKEHNTRNIGGKNYEVTPELTKEHNTINIGGKEYEVTPELTEVLKNLKETN